MMKTFKDSSEVIYNASVTIKPHGTYILFGDGFQIGLEPNKLLVLLPGSKIITVSELVDFYRENKE